jgi:transcriptional regulator GlxA family with amidase domain
VWTSAGVTAGIDCSLAVVEADHGTDIAQEIARWLVMYLRRPGGQSQFATPAWTRQAADGPIRAAQDLVVASPGGDHRIAVLAERVGMSSRHFVRRFTDEVAMSPARWIAAVRIDAARHELERTDDTTDVVARRCGFGTAETLRRSFHRHLGVGPDAYRARFSHQPSSAQLAQHPDADHRHADQTRPHPRSQSASHPRHEDIA